MALSPTLCVAFGLSASLLVLPLLLGWRRRRAHQALVAHVEPPARRWLDLRTLLEQMSSFCALGGMGLTLRMPLSLAQEEPAAPHRNALP
ncbi:hypothetical protein [Variovorax sp. JS1663]|uniref:hypothetical protein n=1 Tax=Variovorax sp. JS1663 TaxID=1851577 RepID=UPI000B349EA2|nr:hypothetical protein [Variovorax sp. JS1663]OUM02569.1 hypothetical protein A8M77_09860 [Variovorax sp. JS1663]